MKTGMNMKKTAKTIVMMTAFMIAAILGSSDVHAEGLGVAADRESCEVGDAITVTVDAQNVGDGTVPADIQVEFDARRLNFENCSAEYGGGGGGLVTFRDTSATVEFTALSGGNAEVRVTATADDAAEPETASVTIAVNGEDTVGASGEAGDGATGVEPGTIDIGEGRVVQTVFADEFKPILFHKETTDYNGQTVECAKFDMGDMTLLYTSDSAGSDGKFMIYNQSTGELTDFKMIQGIENRFIIVLSDCEGAIPDGYTKAVLDWNGQTLTAFKETAVVNGNAVSSGGIDPAEFFLVYAMSSEGNKGWYRYDTIEGTYQRFLTGTASSEGAEGTDVPETDTDGTGILDGYIPHNVQSIALCILAPFALILLVAVIVLAVKLRDYADDLEAFYEDGYYGDEDEDDEEEEEVVAPKKGAVTAASLVGRSMSDEADDEDEDEDEEDEDDEEEEDDEEVDEDEEDEEDGEEEEDDEEVEEDEEDDDEDDEEDEDEEEEPRPLTRRERRELAREEKWRLKEEKKAAKLRAKGYEEVTPMDWSTFEKERDDDVKIAPVRSKPPKYMTESIDLEKEEESDIIEEKEAPRKPLPPRKKSVGREEPEKPHVLHEEDQRERQRRLFEQQQRIEEKRRIENEMKEQQQLKEQQMFIASKTDDLDLDEDFQFEFLDLN